MQVSFHKWDASVSARRTVVPPGGDDVQVWIATAPPGDWEQTDPGQILNRDERARAERFSAGEPRGLFVFGRVFLRQLLGACLKVDPSALIFGYQPRGKPFLVSSAASGDLRFNLSHSGRMVAIALTRGRDVGVDIESVHRLEDWPLLVERIFSPRELRALRALPEMSQREAFFAGWTRKEAYLKATGEGLTEALPAIEVTLGGEPEFIGLPIGADAVRRWEIDAIPLSPDYAGAVVFDGKRG